MKSIIESENQRSKGNREFKNKAFSESLNHYKKVFVMKFLRLYDAIFLITFQAVLLSPSGSKELALAYGNRSAAHFELGKIEVVYSMHKIIDMKFETYRNHYVT